MTKDVLKSCFFALALTAATAGFAMAESRITVAPRVAIEDASSVVDEEYQLAQNADDAVDSDEGAGNNLPIKPRQAAAIAKDAVPGARVLKVKLLPSGNYAVTLRGGSSLTRVTVNGQTGAVN